jgi:3-deoxy-D-manno-octulosonic-acid transferase
MYWLYSAGLGVFFLAMLPGVLLQMLVKGKYRRGMAERFGRVTPWEGQARPVWLHAVSVGEAVAAAPLLRELRARHPDVPVLVSTTTETGRGVAEQRLAADRFVFFPLDFRLAAGAAVGRLRPRLVLLTETELWPNFLAVCAQRGIPVVVINGRISPRSFPRYRLARPWFGRVLRDVGLFCMQSRDDADRLLRLGAPAERVHVTGNLKFDLPAGDVDPAHVRAALGLPPQVRLIVAGSTHRGEEEQVLTAFRGAASTRPDLRLLLAPRHPERLEEVERIVLRLGLTPVRRSALPGAPQGVIVLDTVGELARLYAPARAVFIGGSLIPHGGQNILEPAAHGRPVLHGPHMANFAEVRDLFRAAGAAREVRGAADLQRELEALLDDPARADAMGRAGRAIVDRNRGATRRTADLVGTLL